MPADSIVSIALGPLTEADGSRLVREALGREWQGTEDALRELARESNGSPFFLCELGRYLAATGTGQLPDRVGLEEMLMLRTRDLPPDAQRVVEVFSVAGAPLEQRVALRAAGLREADWVLIANLERQSMLRTTDIQKRSAEIYHHRVRDAILGRMATPTRAKHHQSIANALLSTTNPNPVAAVDHFEAASDDEAVRRYVVAAANYASQVLAFDRAAKLYQRAIDLDSAEMERYELHRRLGLALASAGRGKEAGQAFLHAAEELGKTSGSDQEQVQQLQHKAAEQFIQTGHYGEGMQALRALLAKLEIPFPRTRGEALRKATALRLYSMARGVRLPKGPVNAAAPKALQRFDALWSTNLRLSMVDHTFISYATVRCAIDALKMGEPSRMICSLAFEACNSGTLPGRAFQKRADHLLELAGRLMEGRKEPYERAFFLACRGVVACFRGRFRQTTEDHDEAIGTLRAASQGIRWEFGLWEMWSIIGLAHMGEIKELVRRVGIAREDAEQRQDLFTARNASLGRPTTAWLADDRPEYAIEQADIALGWAPPQYTTQHYQHYIATVEANLYRGHTATAWDRSVKEWPLLRKHYFLMLGFVRDELAQARARASLGLAAALGPGGLHGTLTPASLRASARRDADEMERHGLPCARAWAALLLATIEYQEGRPEAAVSRLRKAINLFDGCEMQLYREGARYCLGRLLGGDEGTSMMKAAEAWMKAQAIRNPLAMVRMVAPGWA
jgi:tetratricopeptide (TPR) repeat protein